MNAKERAYEKKLNELIGRVGTLEDREVARVLGLLETARKDVAAMIVSTEWQATFIPQMMEAVKRAIEGFRQRYQAEQSAGLSNLWNAGIDVVDHPLQFIGIRLGAPEISWTVLEIAQGYSADLIQGLSADALKDINGQIIAGILGEKTPYDVMQRIGRNLRDKRVFTSIAARAEAITRTELARVHSSAAEARMQATVMGSPDLGWKKKWLSSGKRRPRQHHAELNGVMVDVDEDFPGDIPYPHAPGLPASEVVNCG